MMRNPTDHFIAMKYLLSKQKTNGCHKQPRRVSKRQEGALIAYLTSLFYFSSRARAEPNQMRPPAPYSPPKIPWSPDIWGVCLSMRSVPLPLD